MPEKYIEYIKRSVRETDPEKQIQKVKTLLDTLYPSFFKEDIGYSTSTSGKFNFLCDSSTGRVILFCDNKQIVKELSGTNGTFGYYNYCRSKIITSNFIEIEDGITESLPWNYVCLLGKSHSPKIVKSIDTISPEHLYKYYLVHINLS